MRRPLSLIFLFVLFTTPVYLQVIDDSEEVENDQIAAESGLDEVIEPESEAVNKTTTPLVEKPSEASGKRMKGQRNFRPNKKTKLNPSNVVNNGKRPANGRRRWCNDKKGQRKGCAKTNEIVYRPRSSLTDEFNQAVDGMLQQLSQMIANDSNKNAFHARVAFIPTNLRVLPWAYVPLRGGNQTVNAAPANEDRLTTTEDPAVEAEDTTSRTDEEVDSVKSEEEVEDDIESAASETVAVVQDPVETKEPTDQEVQESKIPEIDSEIEEDDDNADDEEDAEESKIEKNSVAYESVSSDVDEADEEADASEIVTQVEQLATNVTKTAKDPESTRLKSRESRRKDGASKKMRKKHQRGKGRFPMRLPRRTNAVVTGLENIRRVGDVRIGDKDNSTTAIDADIEIGPVEIAMKGSAEPNLRKTKATTPTLQATLRLGQRNGKLISVLLKPTKIQPNAALVAIRRRNGQDLPVKHQSARVVTHLSQEMSRLWNSGFFLRRMGRRLKQMYKNDQEFLTLTKKLYEN